MKLVQATDFGKYCVLKLSFFMEFDKNGNAIKMVFYNNQNYFTEKIKRQDTIDVRQIFIK